MLLGAVVRASLMIPVRKVGSSPHRSIDPREARSGWLSMRPLVIGAAFRRRHGRTRLKQVRALDHCSLPKIATSQQKEHKRREGQSRNNKEAAKEGKSDDELWIKQRFVAASTCWIGQRWHLAESNRDADPHDRGDDGRCEQQQQCQASRPGASERARRVADPRFVTMH
jgi:hypothetical protein